jgi:Uma2 family endonuclease
VTCDERDRWRVTEVQSPRVVVEVLSDSTERDDRTKKFTLCRTCPSVLEYVLIATRYQAVEVYRRPSSDWTTHVHAPGETVGLTSINVQLAVSDLYRLTDVPAPGVLGQRADRQAKAQQVNVEQRQDVHQ